LLAKKNQLNAREPAPNIALLDKFLTLEEESRQSPDDKKPKASDKPNVEPTVAASR